jgi:ubiquinone/menaquinone biosynthesis C-methylase UbiE
VTKYIHGETDPAEVARLEKQARFLTRWILDGVEAGPGARVLDLACGTGAMARRLMARLPDAHLFGSDLSLDQLKVARRESAGVMVTRANAAALPFRTDAFDLVHCSWLLEHVPPSEPVPILREVRRVLKPGGVAWLCEVDDDLLAFWPRVPNAEECFRTLWRVQAEGGGDPIIGRKLQGLAREAGFADVKVFPTTLYVDAGAPPGYLRAMIDEFVEILESAREALPKPLARKADDAQRELRALENDPRASITAMCFRARAAR